MDRIGNGGAPSTTAAHIAQRVSAALTRDASAALRLAGSSLRAQRWNPMDRARLRRSLAHALRANGRYREAFAAYRRAQREFRAAGNSLEASVCGIGLVDACMHLGRLHEAERVAEGARRVFRRLGDPARLAKLEVNLGNVYHKMDDLEAALRHYGLARTHLDSVGTALDRARIEHNIANIAASLGRRREAEALYRRSLAAFQEGNEPVLAAQTRYGLACLRLLSGEYAEAVTELERVRVELRLLHAAPILALADLDLAEALRHVRLHAEALDLARSARRWFATHGVPAEAARCDLVAGAALAQMGRTREANRALARADHAFRALGNSIGRASVRLVTAASRSRQGRHDEAARNALSAGVTYHRGGFHLRALAAGALAAESLLHSNREAAARRLSLRLLAQRAVPGSSFSRSRLARVAGSVASRQGNTREAIRQYRAALRELERAERTFYVDEWRVGFLDGEPPVLEELLGEILRSDPPPKPLEIWRVIARRRTFILDPNLGSIGSAPPEIRERIHELRGELEASYGRLWRLHSGGSVRLLRPRAAALEHRIVSLERRLSRLAGFRDLPRRMVTYGGSRPPRLSPSETRLVFFTAGEKIGALRFGGRRALMFANLASRWEVDQSVHMLHRLMETRTHRTGGLEAHRALVTDRANRHLASLGRRLLEPVLEGGPMPRRVHVEPTGPLFQVPFHALPVRGRALCETTEVCVDIRSPQDRRRGIPRRRGLAVFGWDGTRQGAIAREVAAIGSMAARDRILSTCVLGSGATWSLASRIAGQCAIFHIAAHAVYRGEHPEFSSIRLADRWVTASEVAELPLRGACVVLSACESGPRSVVGNGEVLGLIRAFLRAGARSVIATLWRVDGRATCEFMETLYRGWRAHGTLAAGVREAWCRMEGTGDAYLWAPFVLIGAPDLPWLGDVSRGVTRLPYTVRRPKPTQHVGVRKCTP